jgi:BA14K-like protein
MTDIQAHLDKIRADAAECLLLSTLATNEKGEMFAKMAKHLNGLAFEVEKTMATNGVNVIPAAHHAVAAATNVTAANDQLAPAIEPAATHHQQRFRSRRIFPWLLVIVAVIAAGVVFWTNERVENYLSFFNVPSKHEAPPAQWADIEQAIAALLSGEQVERKAVRELLGAIAARVDNLEKALDDLKRARAETVVPSKESSSAEEKPTATETKPSVPDVRESPAAARPSDSAPRTSGNPLVEPVERVGAIASPAGAGLDQHGSSTGPPRCTHFRSYDMVSGTYTAFDGRRRPCR